MYHKKRSEMLWDGWISKCRQICFPECFALLRFLWMLLNSANSSWLVHISACFYHVCPEPQTRLRNKHLVLGFWSLDRSLSNRKLSFFSLVYTSCFWEHNCGEFPCLGLTFALFTFVYVQESQQEPYLFEDLGLLGSDLLHRNPAHPLPLVLAVIYDIFNLCS